MFFPIGDTPNPRNFKPWMTWAIIAVNVALYLLINVPLSTQRADPRNPALVDYLRTIAPTVSPRTAYRALGGNISAYDIFTFEHGYKPAAPELSDLLLALFLHANFLHLAGNMLFLWIFGDNVEHRLGRFGYLGAYLLTGICATLTFALFAGRSMLPLIGASGAISGVLGLYFILFPRNQIKVFLMLFPFFMNTVLFPARWVLGFYILVDNILPFLTSTQSNVAYGAHIGGFFAGLGLAWVGEQLAWHWPWQDAYWRLKASPAQRTSTVESPDISSALAELRDALTQHNFERALQLLTRVTPGDLVQLRPTECVLLADGLQRAGHPIAATRLLRSCMANHPRAADLAEVYLLLGLMRLRQGQPTAAYQYLLSVFDYQPTPHIAERAQALAQIDMFRRQAKNLV